MQNRYFPRGLGGSALFHAAVLMILSGLGLRAKLTEPLALPGTVAGHRLLLTYSPGGQPRAGQPLPNHLPVRRSPPPTIPKIAPVPAPAMSSPPPQMAEAGSGPAGASGLGEGDIKIALPQFNPRPSPDLSSLSHGTSGNVVVDVVIDKTGRVATLTLVKGLGQPIDDVVLQTVHTWVFTPASKNGEVIASEQEILVHYDRG